MFVKICLFRSEAATASHLDSKIQSDPWVTPLPHSTKNLQKQKKKKRKKNKRLLVFCCSSCRSFISRQLLQSLVLHGWSLHALSRYGTQASCGTYSCTHASLSSSLCSWAEPALRRQRQSGRAGSPVLMGGARIAQTETEWPRWNPCTHGRSPHCADREWSSSEAYMFRQLGGGPKMGSLLRSAVSI